MQHALTLVWIMGGASDDNAEPPFRRKIGEEHLQGFSPPRGGPCVRRDGACAGGVSEVIGAIRIPTRRPIMCAKKAYLDMGGCMLHHDTCEIWTHPYVTITEIQAPSAAVRLISIFVFYIL